MRRKARSPCDEQTARRRREIVQVAVGTSRRGAIPSSCNAQLRAPPAVSPALHAGGAALGGVDLALLGLVIVSAGAAALAGLLLLSASGWALRSPMAFARQAQSGRRPLEDEVQRVLAPLEAEGWRLRHSLPWQGRGDIDSVAIAPTGIAVAIETKTRTYEAVISLGCASRRPGCHGAGEGGHATGRSASCASFAPGASSESSRTCSLSRSTG